MGLLPNECLGNEDSYKGSACSTSGGFDVYGYESAHEDPNFFERSYQNRFEQMKDLISLLKL